MENGPVQLDLFQLFEVTKVDKEWRYYEVVPFEQIGVAKFNLAKCEREEIISAGDLVRDSFGTLYVVKRRIFKSVFEQKIQANLAERVLELRACKQTIEDYLMNHLGNICSELDMQFKQTAS